jgi:hypothetical protein
MNKVFVLVFLCIFSTIILNAQDSVLVKNNALQEQKWALQFQVNGINLYSFQKAEGYFNNTSSSASGEISLQKSISLNSALRFGVGMSLSKAYSDAVVKQQDNDVSINCQYLYRPSIDQSVIVYYGIGPGVEYIHHLYHYSHYAGTSNPYYSVNDYFTWCAGIDAAVGVEWFATHSISISAEYFGNVAYQWGKYQSNPSSYSPEVIVTRTVDLTSSTAKVRLGIAAYFNF